VSKESTKTER